MRIVGKCPCGSKPLRWAILLSRYDAPILYDAAPSTRNNGTGVRASIPKQSDKKNMKNMYKKSRLQKNPWTALLGILLPSFFSPIAADCWYHSLLVLRSLKSEDSPPTDSTDPTQLSPERSQDISRYNADQCCIRLYLLRVWQLSATNSFTMF